MFWNDIYYGNTLKEWLISFAIIIGVLILNQAISFLNRKVLLKLAAKSKSQLDDIFLKSLEAPVLFGLALVAIWIALWRLNLPAGVDSIISKSYHILITLNATWFFTRLCNSLIEQYFFKEHPKKGKKKIDSRLMPLIKRVVLVLIWLIGIITALNNVGVKLTTVMGALGIGGLATAMAAQETIKNLFGGFTILVDQSFRIGDVIKLDAFEGTIEDMGMRSTKMRLYDKRLVTIPNSRLTDAMILNVSSEPKRRVLMKLGLTYDTKPEDMKSAMNILRDIAQNTEFIDKKDMSIAFSDFGDSAMIITFVYFVTKGGDVTQIPSNVNLEILERFNAAGLNFAFPSQTIYIEKGEEN